MMPSKKKVLLTVNKAWNAVNFRKGVIRALQAAGFHVVVAAPADGFESKLVEMGCEFKNLPMSRKGLNPFEDLALFFRYIGIYREVRPHVVLGFTIKPNVYGGLAARVMGVPILNNIAGLGTAFMNRGVLREVAVTLYRHALKSANCVFFQNSDDLELFKELKIITLQKVIVLPGSGVDLEYFSPLDLHRQGAKFRFIFVGRMLKDKGVVELVDAVRLLRERGYQDFELHLVGAVDEGNPSAISELQLAEWEQSGLVHYLGVTDDVRGFIGNSDCVVLPSYREGTPRVILEAASMEKVSIVTDVPGCRDSVVDGVTGLKVEVKNPESLAEGMARVLSMSPEVRHEMGRAARLFVQDHYSETLVINQYMCQVGAVS